MAKLWNVLQINGINIDKYLSGNDYYKTFNSTNTSNYLYNITGTISSITGSIFDKSICGSFNLNNNEISFKKLSVNAFELNSNTFNPISSETFNTLKINADKIDNLNFNTNSNTIHKIVINCDEIEHLTGFGIDNLNINGHILNNVELNNNKIINISNYSCINGTMTTNNYNVNITCHSLLNYEFSEVSTLNISANIINTNTFSTLTLINITCDTFSGSGSNEYIIELFSISTLNINANLLKNVSMSITTCSINANIIDNVVFYAYGWYYVSANTISNLSIQYWDEYAEYISINCLEYTNNYLLTHVYTMDMSICHYNVPNYSYTNNTLVITDVYNLNMTISDGLLNTIEVNSLNLVCEDTCSGYITPVYATVKIYDYAGYCEFKFVDIRELNLTIYSIGLSHSIYDKVICNNIELANLNAYYLSDLIFSHIINLNMTGNSGLGLTFTDITYANINYQSLNSLKIDNISNCNLSVQTLNSHSISCKNLSLNVINLNSMLNITYNNVTIDFNNGNINGNINDNISNGRSLILSNISEISNCNISSSPTYLNIIADTVQINTIQLNMLSNYLTLNNQVISSNSIYNGYYCNINCISFIKNTIQYFNNLLCTCETISDNSFNLVYDLNICNKLGSFANNTLDDILSAIIEVNVIEPNNSFTSIKNLNVYGYVNNLCKYGNIKFLSLNCYSMINTISSATYSTITGAAESDIATPFLFSNCYNLTLDMMYISGIVLISNCYNLSLKCYSKTGVNSAYLILLNIQNASLNIQNTDGINIQFSKTGSDFVTF